MGVTQSGPAYADNVVDAIFQAVVNPGKGLAAAKRDYQYEDYVSKLEERGIEEVDLRLTFPDPDQINPYFYLPRFHIEISPHMIDPELEARARARETDFLTSLAMWLVPSSLWRKSNSLTIPIHGNTPRRAYENTSEFYKRWLQNLKARGFTVHKDYKFPRGLREKIAEEDRAPW